MFLQFFIPVVVVAVIHVLLFPLDLWIKDHGPDVQGKNVIVTGSSMGIGRSIAVEFASKGAKNIVVVSRSLTRLENLRSELMAQYKGVNVYVIAMDLSSEGNCKQLVSESIKLMGSLDYLVLNHITDSRYGLWFDNAAGQYKDKSFMLDIFNVNAYSYIWIATAAMENLIKSNGHITVVSSLAGHVGTPYTAAYSASKHALQGFFDALRNELRIMGGNDVKITVCAIGATDTEGASDAKARLPNIAWDSPADAAVAIIKGTTAGKRNIYHPHFKVYPVVFMNSFFPELVDFILRTFM